MKELHFEWDPAKAAANVLKHGVDFDEAASAFLDEGGRVMPDPDHSHAEDRFVLLGMSWMLRLVVVCHCHREDGNTIRIISARRAARAEREQYRPR